MNALPTLNSFANIDMAGLEILYDANGREADLLNGLLCQPRCQIGNAYTLAGARIEDRMLRLHADQDALVAYLRSIRFEDLDEEKRRAFLIIRFDVEMGSISMAELVARVINMAVAFPQAQ